MALHHNPRLVTNGLVFLIDAGDNNSYPGSGTTWSDLSGNDLDVALGNSPTFQTNGIGNVTFNGSNQFGDGPAITGIGTEWTVGVWFYPTSVTNYENVLDCNYAYNATTGNIGPRLEMNSSGRVDWIWSGDTGNNSAFYYNNILSSGLASSTWHYAALSRTSANTVVSFLDGNISTTVSSTGTPTAAFVNEFANLNLGRGFANGGSERYFTGGIAHVHIYNRALTQEELTENYEAQRQRFA